MLDVEGDAETPAGNPETEMLTFPPRGLRG
jgi:hypothetical protein